MLVSRLSDTEQSQWSYTKFETTYPKPASSPRMSNHFEAPLSTQPDWQGQYSYLPPGESNLFSQPFESSNDGAEASRPRPATNGASSGPAEMNSKGSNSSPVDKKSALDPLGIRSAKPPTPTTEHAESQHPDPFTQKPAESAPEESLGSADAPSLPMPSNAIHTISQPQESQTIPPINVDPKEEDDDILDDEEMGGAEEAGDGNSRPQTAAERTALRRKMKRFR